MVPTPTMGGLAMWAGFLVAIGVVPVPALLRVDERDRGRAARRGRHVHADDRSRRDRRPARHLGARQADRADLHRRHPRPARRPARSTSSFPAKDSSSSGPTRRCRSRSCGSWRPRTRSTSWTGWTGWRRGWSRSRPPRSSSTWFETSPTLETLRRRAALRDHRRDLRRVPPLELPSGQDLHGRYGVDAPRDARGDRDDLGRRAATRSRRAKGTSP